MKILEADEVEKQNTESARRWGFMHRYLIGDGKSVYLDRLTLVTTPWFSIKLHRIYRPDNQRELHDHPWTFLSIVLLGWYIEETPDGVHVRKWINWKRAEDQHSIRDVSRAPVWTLVFTGRRRRVWGFWVAGGTRWVAWNEYEKLNQA